MNLLNQTSRTNNMVCPWWLCRTFDNPLRRLIQNPDRLLSPHVQSGMTVADIGCGMGFFTLAIARLVGPNGKVIAVDLQPKMLGALESRARKAGLSDRVMPHLCGQDRLGVEEPVDFVLCFWMAHEVPDQIRFFGEIFSMLRSNGRLLLVEPKIHVTRNDFNRTLNSCKDAGFRLLDEPVITLSLTLLLEKPGPA